MHDTGLLKIARARENQELLWRVAAAMALEAQARIAAMNAETLKEQKVFMMWVFENPMKADPILVSFVSTDTAVSAAITVSDLGVINTSAVLDSDIKRVVSARWDLVANRRFQAPAPAPAPTTA